MSTLYVTRITVLFFFLVVSPAGSVCGGPCPPSANLKLRSVQHYGYEFMYDSNTVDPHRPLSAGIPATCQPMLHRLMETGLIRYQPDQLTVNVYKPGAG